uniref:Uncharacterized protein n=1 Tax=Aegilops tauschii subsp. strangulata TaxID=200361 RepID=A0A453QAT2_AEGTS
TPIFYCMCTTQGIYQFTHHWINGAFRFIIMLTHYSIKKRNQLSLSHIVAASSKNSRVPLSPAGVAVDTPRLQWPYGRGAQWSPCRQEGSVFKCFFVRVCILLSKARQRFSEYVIRFSSSNPVSVVCLASSEGMWRCVFRGSHRIRLVVAFGGSTQILSLFIYIRVSFGWILLITRLFIGDGCGSGARWSYEVLARRLPDCLL